MDEVVKHLEGATLSWMKYSDSSCPLNWKMFFAYAQKQKKKNVVSYLKSRKDNALNGVVSNIKCHVFILYLL